MDDTDETTQAIVRALHATLRERGATLATAESLTGGLLAGLFTAVPGSSATYAGGLVTYATELKQSLLGVPDALVAEHGVVSGACAVAMAQGARTVTGATYALSTTGVAGPDRQEGHPVGTVFVGVVGPGVERAVPLLLPGTRSEVRSRTCREAVSVLTQILAG
ncbi:Putative competence-damage inducible protein [Nocardioides dokdonensis FR1436]|uniref:Putative competence-damage inducible protein n=1 Tax=Nocardioides dokdonensis FR1436 TaxID=1300347 RepID=A0A1A9GM05_9ACTN|nr:CinA family protein [Nocardioides dokdonensis]ANH39319.1 Putative competence-damage inducible protein [Nocardioides dokdonensis FR1436]